MVVPAQGTALHKARGGFTKLDTLQAQSPTHNAHFFTKHFSIKSVGVGTSCCVSMAGKPDFSAQKLGCALCVSAF